MAPAIGMAPRSGSSHDDASDPFARVYSTLDPPRVSREIGVIPNHHPPEELQGGRGSDKSAREERMPFKKVGKVGFLTKISQKNLYISPYMEESMLPRRYHHCRERHDRLIWILIYDISYTNI